MEYKSAEERQTKNPTNNNIEITLVAENSVGLNIRFKHEEDDKIDYNLQRTLPHKFSQSGPGLAIGDVNNDGLEDFVVGGSTNYNASIYKQKADGTFSVGIKAGKDVSKTQEDLGLLLFDADNDNDLDLYTVSGSIESQDKKVYQDRLYLNNGKGEFVINANALPETSSSGSCVRAADFDRDGDLDLFVGGRVIPGSYPMPAKSYVLLNENGKFSDVTAKVCPDLDSLGMITDGLWSDFNGDGKIDLIVVGEFMPITFLLNENGKFVKITATDINPYHGWWNSITGGDFDKDGDVDYIAGNLGLNNSFQAQEKFPLKAFAKDFDGNGSVDPVLACYLRESMYSDEKNLYPVHFWDEINSQSPKFRQKFSRYKQYSRVTVDQLFTSEELKDALILEANYMASAYIENLGNNRFSLRQLPMLVQSAPVNGIVTTDINDDGNLDVMMVGNDYGNEVFVGRYDAFTGLILLGDGKGSFTVMSSATSGFYVPGDAKALAKLYGSKGNELFVATQNKDSIKVFVKDNSTSADIVEVRPNESYAEIVHADGRTQRVELYYGSGYLSQSSRKFCVPKGAKEIRIYNYAGESRRITPGSI